MSNKQESLPRTLTGVVVSDKMEQGIVVLIERRVKHPRFGKYIKRSTKVHAHDVKNACKKGDEVIIQECKPISKTKCWVLMEIKARAA